MKRKIYFLSAILIGVLLSSGAWLHHKDNKRPYLSVVGFVNMADGIGRQSVELIDVLRDHVSTNFISTRKANKKFVPKQVRKIIKKNSAKLGTVVLYGDILWHKDHDAYLQIFKTPRDFYQIRIAYSMFESTKIPPEWVMSLNTYFDAVVVPDQFLIDVYRDCGVKIPIFELPLGLDLTPYEKTPLKSTTNKPFVFANLSSCIERKNHLTLIKAFRKAFGDSKDVQLIINSRYTLSGPKKDVQDFLNEQRPSNIIFSSLCLNKHGYLALFKNVDCYVSLSKAEGFSIQPREAMALGIPVIVADNTAQSTLVKSNLVKSVVSTIEEPAVFFWGDQIGSDFNCEVDEAADALREVYDNYPHYLHNAQAARDWARQYDFKNLKKRYITLVKPKRILLGDKNSIDDDCLTTTSTELYEKYGRLVMGKPAK